MEERFSGITTTIIILVILGGTFSTLLYHFEEKNTSSREISGANEPTEEYKALGISEEDWEESKQSKKKYKFAETLTREQIDSGDYDPEIVAIWYKIHDAELIRQRQQEEFIEKLKSGEIKHTEIYLNAMREQGKTIDHFGIPLAE